jgi:hypothetical protein
MNKKAQQQIDGWAMILFVIAAMIIFIDKNIVGGAIVIILGILRIIYVNRNG